MRIGFDAKRAVYNYTGLGNYSRDLMKSLARYYPENDYLLYSTGFRDNERLSFLKEYDCFTIKTPELSFYKLFKSYWRTFRISKEISRDKIDVFHGLSHELPYGIEDTGIRSVVTIHDLIFIRYPEYYNTVDRRIYENKVKYACKTASAIVATSEQTKRDLVELIGADPSKISVIYQSCHEQFSKPVSSTTIKKIQDKYVLPDKYLLCVGTIEERKNALSLINSLPFVNEDYSLVLVGKHTKYVETLIKRIKELDLQSRVIFLSNVSFIDLPAIYNGAELFLFPSLYEGFGIPILEALCCGIPVITNKSCCFPEVGGPKSKYVNTSDSNEIGEAIQSLLNDEHTRKQMIEAGKKHADKFTHNNFAKANFELYQKLLNEGKN